METASSLSWHERLLGPELTVQSSPLVWFSLGTAALYLARWILSDVIFVKLAYLQGPWNTRLVPPVMKDKGKKVKNVDKNIFKFKDSCWFFFYYTTMVSFGLFLVPMSHCWFSGAEFFFKDYLNHDFTLGLKIYFTVQVSYYISSIIYLFIDTRQEHSDWLMMLFHHITIVVLDGGCLLFGYGRIGLFGTWLHDISDIFLEGAKILRYMGSERGKDLVFFLFACVFTVTRAYVYPLKVVYVVWYEAADMASPAIVPHLEFFGGFLLFLFLLDMVWCGFIWVMAYKMLWTKQLHGDIRSDDEDDF